MTTNSPNDEARIASAVERYLFDAGGEATIAEIRRAIPFYTKLTKQDRRPSRTRPGEEMWEQVVRNIVCHRTSQGNAVNAGKLKYKPRRLALPNGPQGNLFH
jgi:hypothetical protein